MPGGKYGGAACFSVASGFECSLLLTIGFKTPYLSNRGLNMSARDQPLIRAQGASPAIAGEISAEFCADASLRGTRASAWFWFLTGVLGAIQFAFTLHSRTQLRYEEAAESIRNVYWLDLGGIYDGISSNVGYYGLLLAVYRLFGFSLFTAKIVRACLALGTLLSLALIARKTIPGKYGLAVLATVGLSPTMLFLNTYQTSYGMDLQYIPIGLALLLLHPFDRRPAAFALSFIIGFVIMLAAMSYPTVLFSLPLLATWALVLWRRQPTHSWKAGGLHGLVLIAGLVLPLAIGLCWLQRPGLLLFDPHASGHGIFRGGGAPVFDYLNYTNTIRACGRDLFIRGLSYHFELAAPEFGGAIGWLAFGAAGVVLVTLALTGPYQRAFCGLYAMLLLGLMLPALTAGYAGLRRNTAALIAFYIMYALAWKILASEAFFRRPKLRWLAMIMLLLLPAHHLQALVWNWKALPQPSQWSRNEQMAWFNIAGGPQQSLERLLERTKNGEPLVLKDEAGRVRPAPCAEIYAALCGYRRWNHLPPVPLRGLDPQTGRLIELNPKLWDSYTLPH